MLAVRFGLLLFLLAGVAAGQSFEVASIRLSAPKVSGGAMAVRGPFDVVVIESCDRLPAENCPVSAS